MADARPSTRAALRKSYAQLWAQYLAAPPRKRAAIAQQAASVRQQLIAPRRTGKKLH